MKILVSPNAFKGTMTASEVADAIERGLLAVNPKLEIIKAPIADGGDGSLATVIDIYNGYSTSTLVHGPLNDKVLARWAIINEGKTVFIETALIYGLALLKKEQYNPYFTSSRGIGELIVHALNEGYRDFLVGVGGSANNDAGTGMLKALGYRFLDAKGKDIEDGGENLKHLDKIDMENVDPRLKDCSFRFLSDSTVPLVGENGLSLMYSPGKGATESMARALDNRMRHYLSIFERTFGFSYGERSGTGSGGGVTSAGEYYLNATVEYGSDYFLKSLDMTSKVEIADIVITGEGMIDKQTIFNKAPIAIARLAKSINGQDSKVISINAIIGHGYNEVYKNGIDYIISSKKSNNNKKILLPNDIEDLTSFFWLDVMENDGFKNFPEVKIYD